MPFTPYSFFSFLHSFIKGKKVKLQKMKNIMWVFLCKKYSKFGSVLLEHFVELKSLISEE